MNHRCKLSINKTEISGFIKKRPSVTIEETTGLSNWENLDLLLDVNDAERMLCMDPILGGYKFDLDIHLYKDESLQETWKLKHVSIVKVSVADSITSISINFEVVNYIKC